MTVDWQILSSLVLYLLFMVGIGFYFYGKNNTPTDYFLGNRKLGAWVTSMSAQASDMSGWMLMGLPGAVYLAGFPEAWTAIGLALGTYFNWLLVAKRLRQYTKVSGDSITLPEFFSNRFRDDSGILRILCSIFIIIFYLFYTASGFVAGAKLFASVFGMTYLNGLMLSAFIIVVYTFAGGFLAVCWTDFFQGLLMLFAVILVPGMAIQSMGGFGATIDRINAFNPNLLNMLTDATGAPIAALTIASGLAWGLGYFGQPHILVRFMGIDNPNTVKKSRRIATVWVIFALICAVLIGLVGRVFIAEDLSNTASETIYITMVLKLFPGIIAGLFLAALLAAVMSTADSQLLVAASSVTGDFYKNIIHKNASDKELMWVSRVVVVIIAMIAALIATDQDSIVYQLVSFAWAGFGSTFGPLIVFSLFWRRMNKAGAVAGIISGGVTAIGWHMLGQNIGGIFKLYELLPGFVVSSLFIIVVSLMTKAPSQEITDEFDRYPQCTE